MGTLWVYGPNPGLARILGQRLEVVMVVTRIMVMNPRIDDGWAMAPPEEPGSRMALWMPRPRVLTANGDFATASRKRRWAVEIVNLEKRINGRSAMRASD